MAGVCEGECMGHSLGDEPLTLTRYHNYMNPSGRSRSVAEPTTSRGKFLPFFSF